MKKALGKILVLLIMLLAVGLVIYEVAEPADGWGSVFNRQQRQEQAERKEREEKEREEQEREEQRRKEEEEQKKQQEETPDQPDQPSKPTGEDTPDLCIHDWKSATCTEPTTCSRCGETLGSPLGHDWKDTTCSDPKTCKRCGLTEGEPRAHDWKPATCQKPKTCSYCGLTEGKSLEHEWVDATCTMPKRCKLCGQTDGDALGHDWEEATTEAPKTCRRCGETEGEPLYSGDAQEETTKTGSFGSSTGTKLNLWCQWSLTKRTDGTGYITVDVYVSSYSLDLGGRSNGLKITAGGKSQTISTKPVQCEASDQLCYTFLAEATFELSDASGTEVSVAYNAMCTYSGTYIDTITCSTHAG